MHGRTALHQFGGELRKQADAAFGRAVFNRDVAAEDVMGVAISNRRLVSLGDEGVTFKWKD